MSGQRKKAVLKPVKKLEPKKRVVVPKTKTEETPKEVQSVQKKVVKKNVTVKTKEIPVIIEEEQKEVKQRAKPSENKYIKLAIDANQEERKVFGDKVKSGEIKFAYYVLEGDKGYHYYLVFKK